MKEREITLDNITKEEILLMAKTIQKYEQLIKDQRGYIIQLQTQLNQRRREVAGLKQTMVNEDITTFEVQDGKLEL
jgi:hypothetical protein